ncbi:MAG: hypothetical protein Q9184_004172 [Pyrenodesmia sp. 2 TL-2023]
MTLTHNPTPVATTSESPVDLLILGAGWTSNFLIPLLNSNHTTFAATTRTGHSVPGLSTTIPFTFDPDSDDVQPYQHLPPANAILITFPLKGQGQSKRLVDSYSAAHTEGSETKKWIQLGSTGVWKGDGWVDRRFPIDMSDPRGIAEEELLHILGARACILNLAGLWGGERTPKNWVERVAKSKEDVKGKRVLHLVHGEDVARAIVGALGNWDGVGGKRWIVNDLRCWDWWNLILGWKGEEGGYGKWVLELMEEEGVRALPRDRGGLWRVLDGREFWKVVGMVPVRSLLG